MARTIDNLGLDISTQYAENREEYDESFAAVPNLVVIDGIDTIDASTVKTSFLEHSYYGEGESVLADLYEILHGRTPASARSFIRQVVSDNEPVYYVFGGTN